MSSPLRTGRSDRKVPAGMSGGPGGLASQVIDLIGPKGYTHGWVYHGPRGAHVGELSPAHRAILSGRHAKTAQQHRNAAHTYQAVATRSSGVHAEHARRLARFHTDRARALEGGGSPRRSAPAPEPAAKTPGGYGRLPGGKAALTAEGRRQAYKAGHALAPARPGGTPGFPVTTPQLWEKAFQSVGRAGSLSRREDLRQLLLKTAKEYGKAGRIKGSWLQAANPQAMALEFARAVPGHANNGLEFAMTAPRLAVSSPFDLMISRGADGSAIVRHRRGGYEIGRIRRGADGAWVAAADGQDLSPHPRQRGALLELIGTHNKGSGSPYHRPQPPAGTPLQPKPVQTELMQRLGIPAVSAAQLANTTQAAGADDGPRVTGLGNAGQRIYKKLRSRKFPHERAMAFAGRAERRMRGSK